MLDGPGRLRHDDLPLPVLGEDDGLLQVEACGLCGTDHEQFAGVLPTAGPVIPGHEVVGIVAHAGPVAQQRWGVAEGDRVAVEVFRSCRCCPACRAGSYRHCQHHGIGDMVGFVPVTRAPGLWGGYAEWLYLPADSVLVPVPDGLDPVTATLFNPLGAGVRWGVQLPGTGPGDAVVVLGPGVRGLGTLLAARRAGASYIMVTGAGPADRSRLAIARQLGADRVVDVTTDDPVAALRSDLGRLADVVVDVTAKAPAAARQAVALARAGGTVVLAGTRGSTTDGTGIDPDHVVFKELRLLGALGVDAPAYREALDILAAEPTFAAALTRQVVPLHGLQALLTRLADRPADGVDVPLHAVVTPWH